MSWEATASHQARGACRPGRRQGPLRRRAARRHPGQAPAHRGLLRNDLIALGLLQHAIGRGWSVPGDLALVGYDDIEFAAAAAVPLTSVRQPRQELGRTAAELVLDDGNNPKHEHRQVVFTPTLVARSSTIG